MIFSADFVKIYIMDKILVSDIKENQKVDSVFLVKSKSAATGKTGKPYIYLRLSDKTGEIKGYIWDNSERFGGLFEAGDFVKVKSKSSVFQNELQLGISEIEKIDSGKIDENLLKLFLKSTGYDTDVMISELSAILNNTLNDEYVIALTRKFLDDESYMKKLKTMPAAKSIHHGYIGGLLEHTLSMLKIGVFMSKHYEQYVNKNVLIAGIFLHDVGKMEELSNKNNGIYEYSDEGKLLGHIIIGVNIIDKKIDEIKNFPKSLRNLLLHSIISHHGELEFGSPKRPKTIEALLIHFIDNMDAKANQFIDITVSQNAAPWSQYSKQLDRYLLNSKIFYPQKQGKTEDGQAMENPPLKERFDEKEDIGGGTAAGDDGKTGSNKDYIGELF